MALLKVDQRIDKVQTLNTDPLDRDWKILVWDSGTGALSASQPVTARLSTAVDPVAAPVVGHSGPAEEESEVCWIPAELLASRCRRPAPALRWVLPRSLRLVAQDQAAIPLHP